MDFFDEIVKFDPVNHYVLLTVDELKKLKSSLSKESVNELKSSIKYLFSSPFRSVIDKLGHSPSLDLHDYVSLATYYWPNPDTKDGLPYINKDGYSNPEGLLFDKDALRSTAYLVYYSALMFYITEEKIYYDLLEKHIYHFFINEETKMNPNMNHGQMIRGINTGRGIGIIDYAGNFTYALHMINNLYKLKLLPEKFYDDLYKWHYEFYEWLNYSKIALEEKYANNNHGTMYDLLMIVLSDFLKIKDVTPLIFQFIELRLIPQMNEDGSLPQELARTKSISYSLMGFKAMYDFAKVAKTYNHNLYDLSWYYKKINGSFKKGFDYLYHYLVLEKEPWAYKQITIFDKATLIPLIYEAKELFGNEYNFLYKYQKNDVIHRILSLFFVSA